MHFLKKSAQKYCFCELSFCELALFKKKCSKIKSFWELFSKKFKAVKYNSLDFFYSKINGIFGMTVDFQMKKNNLQKAVDFTNEIILILFFPYN